MKNTITFTNGKRQVDVRENGAEENFYGQRIVAVSVAAVAR